MVYRLQITGFVYLGVAVSSFAQSPIDIVAAEKTTVSEQRRVVLQQLASTVADSIAERGRADVTFICTHNSRRSQLAQVWLQTAADHVGLGAKVRCFSGGTEATACNHRTIAALRRAGFEITVDDDASSNPRYEVRGPSPPRADADQPLILTSKVYDEAPNPRSDFIAVMCCGDADEKCPVISGAFERIALLYVDPKVADDTPLEVATYDQRCRQIGAEMLWVAERVAETAPRVVTEN